MSTVAPKSVAGGVTDPKSAVRLLARDAHGHLAGFHVKLRYLANATAENRSCGNPKQLVRRRTRRYRSLIPMLVACGLSATTASATSRSPQSRGLHEIYGHDESAYRPSADPFEVLRQPNKWGWDLSQFQGLGGAYALPNGIYFLMGMPKQNPKGVGFLWNPMNGDIKSLPSPDFSLFERKNIGSLIYHNAMSAPVFLGNGTEIRMNYIPWSGRCAIPFDHFYTARDKFGNVVREFYIIRRRYQPKTYTVRVCEDGAFRRETYTSDVEDAAVLFVPLPDGSVLFSEPSKRYLMRLDTHLQAHSSIDGRIFVLDHDPISRLIDNTNDPNRQAEAIEELLRASPKDATLHRRTPRDEPVH